MNLFSTFGLIIGLFLASLLKMGFFIGLIFSLILSGIFKILFRSTRANNNDQYQSTENNLFLITTFEVLGHISKSKGVITPLDIQSANQLMQALGIHGASKRVAEQAFRSGKQSDYPLEQKIAALRTKYLFRPYFLNLFMEIQIKHVLIDGVVHVNEQKKLETIAKALGIDNQQFRQLLIQYSHQFSSGESDASDQQRYSSFYTNTSETELNNAYRELQVNSTDDPLTIKRAYRRLMGQYHPDKIVATATSAEAIEIANKKAQSIQAAYQLIKQRRSDL